jgi:hypothetical protein
MTPTAEGHDTLRLILSQDGAKEKRRKLSGGRSDSFGFNDLQRGSAFGMRLAPGAVGELPELDESGKVVVDYPCRLGKLNSSVLHGERLAMLIARLRYQDS